MSAPQHAEPADPSAVLRHAIADAVIDALAEADCTWHQAMAEVSFVLAVMLAECVSKRERMRIAGLMSKGLLEVARTGELPRPEREMLQ